MRSKRKKKMKVMGEVEEQDDDGVKWKMKRREVFCVSSGE